MTSRLLLKIQGRTHLKQYERIMVVVDKLLFLICLALVVKVVKTDEKEQEARQRTLKETAERAKPYLDKLKQQRRVRPKVGRSDTRVEEVGREWGELLQRDLGRPNGSGGSFSRWWPWGSQFTVRGQEEGGFLAQGGQYGGAWGSDGRTGQL